MGQGGGVEAEHGGSAAATGEERERERKRSSGAAKPGAAGPATSSRALNEFFGRYQDPAGNLISADGIQRLCEDLGITALDPVTLAIAHHCHAKSMGEFSHEEFCRGMGQLGCDSSTKLKARLPDLRRELEARDTCKRIYAFTFRFSLDEGVRNLPQEVAIELWKLLLPPHFVLLDQWLDFVQRRARNTISEDVWMMVWDLATQVSQDLSNYDDDNSWPVLLDEFVAEVRAGRRGT